MKNICFFSCDYQMGGANTVAVKLANGLCDKYNVFFVAAHDTEETAYGKENIDKSIRYFNFGLSKERIIKMRGKVMPRMKRFIKEHEIDLVFAIGYYAAFYIAPIFWKNKKCKFVFCEHGAPANQIADKKGTLMRKINVRAFDMTVALTKRSEADFVTLIGAKPSKVTTIYNWIDDKPSEDGESYRADVKKILTVGRISGEKGFDMLADIARDVFARFPDCEWHIMGDGPERADFENRIKEYGIEKNIVMHGSVADACRYFGEYSVMALTSYREGLPLVLLEAKAKKLPCISFDVVTGPSEIIRDGVNGYLIPMYDKGLFADKLCALMQDESLRKRFSDNACLDIEKFKPQKILAEWIALTEKLTEKK